MDIKINEKVVTDAVALATTEGIIAAVNGYEFKAAIQQAAGVGLGTANLVRKIDVALTAALTANMDAVAVEIANSITSALIVTAVEVVRASMLDMLYRLESGGHYLDKNAEAVLKREIRDRLWNDPVR